LDKRYLRIGVALAIAAGVIVAQRVLRERATAPADGPAPIATPETGGFTLGSLAFTSCELAQPHSGTTTAAWCAPFQVPEDWDAPEGRHIDLKLALVRSDAQVAERDLVVLLAGGPGEAATESYAGVAGALAPLRKHRHVLLLDQRGTGGSHALTCPQRADAAGNPATASGEDLDGLRAAMRECLATIAQDADPALYTTSAAVRDLEAVRQALGAPRFDLVGVSYGTRVAQQYLRRYPDGVRSVVLDSVVPNELALGSEFATNLDAALRAQFAECAKSPACEETFGDTYANLHALHERLAAQPVEVDYRDPRSFEERTRTLDGGTLVGLVRLFAYTPETSALLPLAIAEAGHGNYAPLLGQADLVEDLTGDLATSGMQFSVICAEDADLLEPRPQDAGLLLGDELGAAFRAACEVWPRGTRPADFHEPIESDKPVLVLEGEFDPVTPPRYGEAVVEGLANGRLLVARGQGHNVIGRGCIPTLVERFVETLDAAALDAGCLADLGPIPAFLDYNGAAP
jgi:pimeloyl-ACP methyl ester carboxylesterase